PEGDDRCEHDGAEEPGRRGDAEPHDRRVPARDRGDVEPADRLLAEDAGTDEDEYRDNEECSAEHRGRDERDEHVPAESRADDASRHEHEKRERRDRDELPPEEGPSEHHAGSVMRPPGSWVDFRGAKGEPTG